MAFSDVEKDVGSETHIFVRRRRSRQHTLVCQQAIIVEIFGRKLINRWVHAILDVEHLLRALVTFERDTLEPQDGPQLEIVERGSACRQIARQYD